MRAKDPVGHKPKQYHSEANIQNQIRVALSEHGIVFRTNAGEFWQGTLVYSEEFHQRVLINLRRVEGMPAGFSDLLFIGHSEVAFIETKTATGKEREAQLRFLKLMARMGHRAGVARNVKDALKIIKEGTDDAVVD
ncbi:MAG: VRR-NUC domain-containing protein [Oscillospiraceae bacterium]